MDALDNKLTEVFAGKVVRKDLVRKVKVGANVPVFVLEYLLGKYCATEDESAIDAGLRVVKAASHNWWKFDLTISYTLLPSQSITLSNQYFF